MSKSLLFLSFCLLILRGVTTAQNPYESLGKTTEVLTLSNGKYQEFMTNDTLVQIGSVLFNTVTNEVVSFLNEDTLRLMDADLTTRFLSVDPIGKQFPELTPYQFASNTPINSIDLDGLEAWIVVTKYNHQMKPVNEIWTFDKTLAATNGVYFSNYYYNNQGDLEGMQTGGVKNYSEFKDKFPNFSKGVHAGREDGKSLITFDFEGGITYGHAAAEADILGKKVGFNFQAGNYLIGGSYNSSTGGSTTLLKTDELNMVAEVGGGIGSINMGGTYKPTTAEMSNVNGGIGLPLGKLDLSPTNSSLSIGGNSNSVFIGPEMNAAFGIGVRLKAGFSYNPQTYKLTSYEKTVVNNPPNKNATAQPSGDCNQTCSDDN